MTNQTISVQTKLDWTLECGIKESRLPETFLIMDILMFGISSIFVNNVHYFQSFEFYQRFLELLRYYIHIFSEPIFYQPKLEGQNKKHQKISNLQYQALRTVAS